MNEAILCKVKQTTYSFKATCDWCYPGIEHKLYLTVCILGRHLWVGPTQVEQPPLLTYAVALLVVALYNYSFIGSV